MRKTRRDAIHKQGSQSSGDENTEVAVVKSTGGHVIGKDPEDDDCMENDFEEYFHRGSSKLQKWAIKIQTNRRLKLARVRGWQVAFGFRPPAQLPGPAAAGGPVNVAAGNAVLAGGFLKYTFYRPDESSGFQTFEVRWDSWENPIRAYRYFFQPAALLSGGEDADHQGRKRTCWMLRVDFQCGEDRWVPIWTDEDLCGAEQRGVQVSNPPGRSRREYLTIADAPNTVTSFWLPPKFRGQNHGRVIAGLLRVVFAPVDLGIRVTGAYGTAVRGESKESERRESMHIFVRLAGGGYDGTESFPYWQSWRPKVDISKFISMMNAKGDDLSRSRKFPDEPSTPFSAKFTTSEQELLNKIFGKDESFRREDPREGNNNHADQQEGSEAAKPADRGEQESHHQETQKFEKFENILLLSAAQHISTLNDAQRGKVREDFLLAFYEDLLGEGSEVVTALKSDMSAQPCMLNLDDHTFPDYLIRGLLSLITKERKLILLLHPDRCNQQWYRGFFEKLCQALLS